MKKTVLSFGAHPDDIEIGCAGTEALLMRQGYDLIHVVLTSGEQGARGVPQESLAKIRESEAIESAKSIGVRRVEFFRFPDGLTQYTPQMKLKVIRFLRQIRPDIVFIHSSQDHFPDHRVAHDLVMSALTAASGPWYPEVVELPHHVSVVYGYEVWHPISSPQVFVDISSVIEQKVSALKCHLSQISLVSYDEAFLGLARYRGALSMKSNYAEAFEVIQSEVMSVLC